MKKILALILAAVMLCTFVACSNVYKDYDKYISVGDTKKISIEEAKILAKVADAIFHLRDEAREELFVKLEDKDAISKNGDKLNIDYSFKSAVDKDGKEFKPSADTLKGMSSKGYDLVLGSNSFIGAYEVKDKPEDIRNNKGFEEQLVGVKVNSNDKDDATKDDKVEVKVTFPSDYKTAELRDIIVVFEVTVNSISRSAVELTNEELIVALKYVINDPDKKEEVKDDTTTEGDNDTTTEGGNDTTTEGDDDTNADTNTGTDNDAGTEAQTGDDDTNTEGDDDTNTEGDNDTNTEGDDDTNTEGDDDTNTDEGDKPESTTKFSDLFKDGKLEIDLSTDEFKTFNTIFDIKTVYDALDGKVKLDSFDIVFKVPSEADLKEAKNDKFIPYADREITVTFTVEEITTLPEWNDEFVKTQSKGEYTKAADYEADLEKGFTEEMVMNAIIDFAEVKKLPEKEVKKAYKTAVQNGVLSALQSAVGSSTMVNVSDFTQKELDTYISDEVYDKIYESAAESAAKTVKSRLVYEYIFDKLGVTLTKKEYKAELQEMFDTNYSYYYYYYGITSVEDLEDYFGKDSLETEFKSMKISEDEELYKKFVALVTIVPAE